MSYYVQPYIKPTPCLLSNIFPVSLDPAFTKYGFCSIDEKLDSSGIADYVKQLVSGISAIDTSHTTVSFGY